MSPSGKSKFDLSEKRQALLDSLLKDQGKGPAGGEVQRSWWAAPGEAEGDRERRSPLSFAQERFWFLDRLQPGNPVYHVPAMIPFHGALDIGAPPPEPGRPGEPARGAAHDVRRRGRPAGAGRGAHGERAAAGGGLRGEAPGRSAGPGRSRWPQIEVVQGRSTSRRGRCCAPSVPDRSPTSTGSLGLFHHIVY